MSCAALIVQQLGIRSRRHGDRQGAWGGGSTECRWVTAAFLCTPQMKSEGAAMWDAAVSLRDAMVAIHDLQH